MHTYIHTVPLGGTVVLCVCDSSSRCLPGHSGLGLPTRHSASHLDRGSTCGRGGKGGRHVCVTSILNALTAMKPLWEEVMF